MQRALTCTTCGGTTHVEQSINVGALRMPRTALSKIPTSQPTTEEVDHAERSIINRCEDMREGEVRTHRKQR